MIKMRGILAVPGQHTRGEQTYIKTKEELQDAAQRFPIIPLTYGHIMEGEEVKPETQIGTVSQKCSDSKNAVVCEFWFHEEKIPEVLKKKLDNGERIPISAGYSAYVDEEGNQSGLSYTHVAVLDEETPVCPVEKCGVFERQFFIEQIEEIEPKAAEKEPEVAPEETPLVEEPVVEEEPKPEPPVEQKPKEPDEQAPPIKEEVRLEPEVMIPVETPSVQKPFELIDGIYSFVPEVFKQQEKKK